MKRLLFITLFFLINTTSFAQEISYPERENEISVFELIVEGIDEERGGIRIAVFDSEEAYADKEEPLHAIVLPVEENRISWKQDSLPYGKYAIAVYHDKNVNGELDSNLLGIPKEAYGFSNNARGRFGPASWKDAHFEITSQQYSMTITIK